MKNEIENSADPFVLLKRRKQSLGFLSPLPYDHEVVRIVRGKKCHTKKSFFDEISAAFQFPHYFGENWDAFDECINDLGWLEADKYLLIIEDVDQLFASEPWEEFDKLMRALRRTARDWESGLNYANFARATGKKDNKKIEFKIILQLEPEANISAHVENWLTKAGISTLI